MPRDFQNIFNFSLSFSDVLVNLTVALICGLMIGFFYKITYRGSGYTNSFLNSLILLTMITSVVIMVIGNNLARAFGLVGAMSIIRFRTAVKEPLDIMFIFFSLAIGLAAGVGLFAVAIGGTIFIGIVLIVLTKTSIISSSREEYLLQFYYAGADESNDAPYLAVLKKYCKSHKLINIKSLGNGDGLELSFYVHLKQKDENAGFIKELKTITGLNHVNLFFDEEHF
ncbi:MAG: DUF4956 domain-containing protein [Ignavibacteriales bacterium]|nr:DUF4956 domain-containing protein [Ignavibacteriales bacterium]